MSRRRKYTEDNLQLAIQSAHGGTSRKGAARVHGVPRPTLQGRLKGATSMNVAMERYQRLTPFQEQYVSDWVHYINLELGRPPSKMQIAQFAHQCLTADDERPLGVHWITRFLDRHPDVERVLAGSSGLPHNLLYDTEASFHWSQVVCLEREIFASAIIDPRWTDSSRFEFQGATQTYHAIKCSILHFQVREPQNGGRILRIAFDTLAKELNKANPAVIQDVALNIFGYTLRERFPDIGLQMLRYCSALFKIQHESQLYCTFFQALGRIFCFSPEQSSYYLSHLTGLYADELGETRSYLNRSSLQAKRRHLYMVRDSNKAHTQQDAEEMMNCSEHLLLEAIRDLGAFNKQTLRIEIETLRMQAYLNNYQDDHIWRVEQSRYRITQLYVLGQLESGPYRSALLRYLEREFDYYKHHNKLHEAIRTAERILGEEGYRTDRWIVFCLQFEIWLTGLQSENQHAMIKPDEWLSHYRQKRLESGYYKDLQNKYLQEEANTL
ncbi:transposase [Fusarium mundagurra]|uniref:Transposase n=1 Tax=Fusarium mundagurra TaxID=1567541 RepID=A0A8H5Z346_9HYPO|nr:transposase [Fusarium mundagurra]